MARTEAVFDALGDPTRRHIVLSLARRSASATALAAELPISRQAVAKHLVSLRDAELVVAERVGRETLYTLDPRPLAEAARWIERVGEEWDRRLASLRGVLDKPGDEPGLNRPSPNI